MTLETFRELSGCQSDYSCFIVPRVTNAQPFILLIMISVSVMLHVTTV